MSCAGIPASEVQMANFHKKNINDEFTIFLHFYVYLMMLSLGHWYTRVYLRIFDPGPSNLTNFLGLCSPGDYRQSIVSNGRPHLQLNRKVAYIHYLCLYSENTAKKGVLFDES